MASLKNFSVSNENENQVLLVWFLRRKSEKVVQNPAAHEYIQHYGNQAALKVAE